MNKPLEELNMSDDYLFMAVFKDEGLCKRFLETILGIQIQSITYMNEQQDITTTYDNRSIRLDVYVKDEKHTVYNVEMQTSYNDNLLKRARYYQALIDSEQLEKGKSSKYEHLKKTYIIFICTFDPFSIGKHLYQFERICTSDESVKVTDDTVHLFLNTKGIFDDVDEEVIEVLKYIENSTDEVAYQSDSKLVQDLNKKVQKIKVSEKERKKYMTLELRDREKIEEGIAIGKAQGAEEIAKSLLSILDDETIAETTGVSIEKVRQLRK